MDVNCCVANVICIRSLTHISHFISFSYDLRQTFWLDVKGDATHSSVSGGDTSSVATEEREPNTIEHTRKLAKKLNPAGHAQKSQRLVEWNTDILLRLLRSVVAQRQAEGVIPDAPSKMASAEKNIQKPGTMVFDEIADIISMPESDSRTVEMPGQNPVEIEKVVVDQLREYVSCIAGLYKDNSFHNFGKVTLSCFPSFFMFLFFSLRDLFLLYRAREPC